MLLSTIFAIAVKGTAKVLIGKAIKEIVCTGDTNVQALDWAVDTLGNQSGHADLDDVATIGSDLWDFATSLF